MDSLLRRRRGLSGLIGLAGLALAGLSIAPAGAQQVIAGKGSVTIDLGVLNQLGQPIAGGYAPYGQAGAYPQAIYGRPVYGQPAYGQPAYNGYPAQAYGGLLFPPQQYPVSALTVQPPVGSAPYVPPSTTASMPATPASTGTTESTGAPDSTGAAVSASVANSTAATPPPPPTPAATTVPMESATTTTTEAGTGTDTTTTDTTTAGVTTTGASTDTTATAETMMPAPAVPTATPITTTDTGATAATTDTTATQPAAPATTGTESTTAATGATGQTQTASIPPAAAIEGQIRIAFPADSTEIPDAVKAELDALAQKMASDDNMRIQLLAYASGTPETASRARRMSLSRALAVRSYLIKQGVRSTRMDVRALGNNVEGSPADRVDIIPKAQ